MDNNKYNASLNQFFKKYRLLKRTEQVTGKKTHKLKTFKDKFSIVKIKNNEQEEHEEIYVNRNEKLNINILLNNIEKKQNEISKILLESKYKYLYDYKSIETFEDELKNLIEPYEEKYKNLTNMKNKYNNIKLKIEQEINKKIEEKKLMQNVIKEELIELALQEKDGIITNAGKTTSMKEYIDNEKEIYELMTQRVNIFENYDINNLNDSEVNIDIEIETLEE